MPTYDYERADGTVFEAFRPYGSHRTATDEDGVEGFLVWRTPPAAIVPAWHQSAPNEDEETVARLKRAADPKDPVRLYEPGMRKDAERAAQAKKEKADKARDHNIAEAIREVSPDVPE